MTSKNVFHVQHSEANDPAVVSASTSTRTQDVMAAGRLELDNNRAQLVNEVRQQAIPEIEAAVKRALEGTARTADNAAKRSCRPHHTFRNKGNEKRYEKNAEIIDTIADAMDAIGGNQLETAKKALEKGTTFY